MFECPPTDPFECPPQTRQSGSHPGDPWGGAGRSPPLQGSGYCRADPRLWPPPAPRDAHALREDRRLGRVHLLLQLVLIALPGQLILVLGPLGRERVVCTRPGHRSHGPGWDSAGAGPKERPACPNPAALRPGAAASPHSGSSSAPRPAPGPARPSAAPRRPHTPARHTSRPEPRAWPGLPPRRPSPAWAPRSRTACAAPGQGCSLVCTPQACGCSAVASPRPRRTQTHKQREARKTDRARPQSSQTVSWGACPSPSPLHRFRCTYATCLLSDSLGGG